MKTISRRELRFILNKVKDKFNLDRVETKGICCGICTAYEYRSYDKRVVWNKWFESGFIKLNGMVKSYIYLIVLILMR